MSYSLEQLNPRLCIAGQVQRIGRITSRIFRKHLSPHQITDSQLSILFIVAKRGSIAQGKLAVILRLEKSSLSRNLERLLGQNLLEREASGNIKITRTGVSKVEAVLPAWQQAMKEMEELLSGEGVQALAQLHSRIVAN